MKKIFIVPVVITLFAFLILANAVKTADAASVVPGCGPGNAGAPTKNWRVGVMYSLWTNESTSDLLGNGLGVEVERSFGHVWIGDLSGVVNYRRFSEDAEGFDNSMNYYGIGAKYRFGQGASPSRDGFYYGLGVSIAILDEEVRGIDDTSVGVEGAALLGINFARSWYGEFSYRSPADAKAIDSNNLVFELGYRF